MRRQHVIPFPQPSGCSVKTNIENLSSEKGNLRMMNREMSDKENPETQYKNNKLMLWRLSEK